MVPSRRAALAAVVVVVAGVGLGTGCKAKPPAAPALEPRTPEEAEREIAALLDEAYQSLKRNNAPGMMSLIAADAFLAGPRFGDVAVERSEALVAVGEAVRGKKAPRLRSSKLQVGGAPEGRSAWAIDQLELNGKPLVVVALGAEVDGMWALTAIQVARLTRDAEAPAASAASAWAPASGGAHRPAPPEVATVVAQLTGEPERRLDYLDHYADRESMVVRSGPKSAVRGVKDIKKAWKKQAPVWTLGEALASATTPDGAFAWALLPAALDGEPAGTRRVFIVLERFVPEVEGDAEAAAAASDAALLPWRLVVLHESAPSP